MELELNQWQKILVSELLRDRGLLRQILAEGELEPFVFDGGDFDRAKAVAAGWAQTSFNSYEEALSLVRMYLSYGVPLEVCEESREAAWGASPVHHCQVAAGS